MSDTTVPLGRWPTPLHPLERLTTALDAPPLYVKRDDLCGFGFAGTKARALERLLADALARGADTLVVGGGPASNLVPATAGAARSCGLRCVAVLYGRDDGHATHANLALARWLGAEVRFTGSSDRSSVDTTLPEVVADVGAAGGHPYLVPRGGATPVATAGTARAIAEVAAQLGELGVQPATLVVATGSGGIHAGLLAGSHAAGMPWSVVGMSVSRTPDEVTGRVARLAAEAAGVGGWDPPPPAAVHLRDVRGEGYGIPSAAGTAAATLAAHTEGLLLDPIYTAKAFAGLELLLDEGVEGPVLLWHTGGTGGVLATLAADRDPTVDRPGATP